MVEQCLIIQTRNSGNIWNTRNYWRGWARGKVLTVLSKLFCHITILSISLFKTILSWLKSNNKGKKVILKLSRRKDSNEIRRVRNKLKTADLKAIGIATLVYIKFIFGYWVRNDFIKFRISEPSPLFPYNLLLKDDHIMSSFNKALFLRH